MYNKTQRKPLISIIALNWNGKKFIDPLVGSINKQKLNNIDIEFLFVDNNSEDGSVKYFQDNYKQDNFKVIQNDANYGYSKGNNLGIKHAKGDYVLVCNNDLVMDDCLVQNLYDEIVKNEADLAVPKLMFLNKPGYINNAGSVLEKNNSWPVSEIGFNEEDRGQYNTTKEITAFCGACVLFTRDFLHTVGLYDDKFFMYFEDSDLSWRGQDAGKKFIYAPSAVAHHHHTGTSIEGSKKFNYFVARNRVLILLKNASFRVIGVGYKFAVRDHLYFKVKNVTKAVLGKYSKKQAVGELWLGFRTFCGILCYTPYALLKRWGVIKEIKL